MSLSEMDHSTPFKESPKKIQQQQNLTKQKMNIVEDEMEDLPYLETLNFRSKTPTNMQKETSTPISGPQPIIREFGIPTSLDYSPDYTTPQEEDEEDDDISELTRSSQSTNESKTNELSISTSASSQEDIFSLSEDFEEDEDKFTEPRWLLGPQPLIHEGKLTVVLDMDETLVHSEFLNGEDYQYRQEEDSRITANNNGPDFFLDVCDGVAVHTRPWLSDFLEHLAKHFEVGIFTAAEEVYAGPVLDTIDPNNYISFRLFRDSTVEFQGTQFVKDLSRVGRDLRRTVLIDNNLQATLASPDNSLMIEDYYGDNSDKELKRILALLHRLDRLDDIRPMLRSRYQNEEYDWELEEMDNIDADFL